MLLKLKSVALVFLLMFLVNSPLFAGESKGLRLALLPIPDVLPAYVAKDLGLFEKAGLDVTMLPVGSGMERDQLMQAGQVDGILNELISTASFNRDKIKVQVVAVSRKPTPEVALFRLISKPESGINGCEDLVGRSVVISKNTVIDYVTEKLLLQCEIDKDRQKTMSVPSLPERYQLLMSGQVEAVTLPEPLASSAIAAGAKEVVDDTLIPEQSLSVLSFSADSINNKHDEIVAFVKAWQEAAAAINKDPEKFRDVMLKNIRVPGNIRTTYQIPPFVVGDLPSEKIWADTMDWMIARGLLQEALSYEGSISKEFVGQ